jgi:hypothetical protein
MSDRPGFLQGVAGEPLDDPKDIARLIAADPGEVKRLLAELEKNGVFSRNDSGFIYSRRMVRDVERSESGRQFGLKGGNPQLKQPPQQAKGLTQPLRIPAKPTVAMDMGTGTGDPERGTGGKPETDPAVEPLPSFPKTEDEALAKLPTQLQEQREWVVTTFHKARYRGGRDARGIPITNWPSYAAVEWSYERQRRGNSGPNSFHDSKPVPKFTTGESKL